MTSDPKVAVLWPFFFSVKGSWSQRMEWLASAIESQGYRVERHPRLECCTYLPEYKGASKADIVVFNHTDVSKVKGRFPIKAKKTWFFKPTVPDSYHATLDRLGFGPFSEITYEKPDYMAVQSDDVDLFFDQEVKGWIEKNSCKWGENHFPEQEAIPQDLDDFILVIGQMLNDEVVNHQALGGYAHLLWGVIEEARRVSSKPIVVKMHPKQAKESPGIHQRVVEGIEKMKLDNVHIFSGYSSIHQFLPQASCVITANSGSGYEAMMHDVPIISFGHPEYHWETFDLRKRCEMSQALDTDSWYNTERTRKFLYWYMKEYCFYDYTSAVKRVRYLLSQESDQ